MSTQPPGGSEHGWATPEQPAAGGWGPPPEQPGYARPPQAAPGAPPAGQGWAQLSGPTAQPYGSVLTRRGIIALKPLGFGDFFDGAFRAMRHNPRAMIGLSALVIGITNLLVSLPLAGLVSTLGFSETDVPSEGELLALGGSLLALVPLGFLQTVALVVLTGLLMLSVTQSVVDRRLRVGELWQRARGRVLALVGWSLLQSLGGALLLALALAPGIALLVAQELVGGAVLLTVMVLAAVVVGVWLAVELTFVPVLIVVERLPVIAAIKRSFSLVRGAFWRTLLVLFLAVVLTQVVSSLLSAPFSFAGGLSLGVLEQNPVLAATIYAAAITVGTTVATVIAFPFLAAVIALLYVDRRIRREGLDVALARTLADEGGA